MLFLKLSLSILLVLAGGPKLLAAKPIAEQFAEFGLPAIAMYAVGALELAAAVGVQVNALAFCAAVGTSLLMLGALRSHWQVRHGFGKFAPAMAVLGLAGMLAYRTMPWLS